jgi:hypothetical protein
MTFLKRIVGLLVFLLSIVFFGVCAYGIVEAWLLKPKLTQSTGHALSHVDEVLSVTANGIREVQSALAQANANLQDVKSTSSKSEGDDASRRLALKMAAWKISNDFGSQISSIRANLSGVSQAAVVLDTLVQDFDKAPLTPIPKVDVERLQTSSEQLAEVGKSAQELAQLLSNPSDTGTPLKPADVASRTTPIEKALKDVQAVAADFEVKVADSKTRVAWVQSSAPNWINWGTLAVTGVLLWIAISQVSLMCHSWGWMKRGETQPD